MSIAKLSSAICNWQLVKVAILSLLSSLTVGAGNAIADVVSSNPQADPVLEIISRPSVAGQTVAIPIRLQTNGQSLSALIFSVDYDERWLRFDPTDANGDDRPDAIQVNVPNAFSVSIAAQPSDTQGELDFTVLDLFPPLATLPSTVLFTITFAAESPPTGVDAVVGFASEPPPSVSSNLGATLNLTTTEGVVSILGAPAVVQVAAEQTSLPADGASSSVITATVSDSLGRRLPDQAVEWNADKGAILGTTKTDARGVAAATLTASVELGVATVQARAGAASGAAMVRFVAGPPASMTVVATPNNVVADGVSKSLVTATVRDAFAHPVADYPVNLASSMGNIAATATTNASGVATSELTAPLTLGTAIVTATAGSAQAVAHVTFMAGLPASLSVTALPTSLIASGDSQTLITAVVRDGQSHPLSGVIVAFSTTLGAITEQVTTGDGGVALATLTADATLGRTHITATVATGIVLLRDSLTLDFVIGPPANLLLHATDTSIYTLPDPRHSTTFTITVLGAGGHPLANQTVTLSTTLGSVQPGTVMTNEHGRAQATLSAGESAGQATIYANVANTQETLIIQIVASPAPPPTFRQHLPLVRQRV